MYDPIEGTIYLLCFDRRLAHAKHYIGWTSDLDQRLGLHAKGQSGAKLMEAVHAAGIGFQCSRTWTGTRNDERKLKNRRDAMRMCPLCHPKKKAKKNGKVKRSGNLAIL